MGCEESQEEGRNGQTYTVGNGTRGGLLAGTRLEQSNYTGAGTTAYVLNGQHAVGGAFMDVPNNAAYFAVNGDKTMTLPTQTADYLGYWMLTNGANGGQGLFDARVDFNAGNIGFKVYDNRPMAAQIGSGTGKLQATGFTSTFNTTGTFTSANTVNGQFYGPRAEEMAGLIKGNAGGQATAGFLIGQQ